MLKIQDLTCNWESKTRKSNSIKTVKKNLDFSLMKTTPFAMRVESKLDGQVD